MTGSRFSDISAVRVHLGRYPFPFHRTCRETNFLAVTTDGQKRSDFLSHVCVVLIIFSMNSRPSRLGGGRFQVQFSAELNRIGYTCIIPIP